MSVDDVRLVRGEMTTWSDLDARPPVDPVTAAVVRELLPAGERALVAGPHAPDVVAEVAARHTSTTVLVRSVLDARRLAAVLPASCAVVAGSLDALDEEGFDAVVAADGLDRVLGADAPDLDWRSRLALVRDAARPGAALLVGLENEAAVTALLDRRPPHERHGDEEWAPLHDDRTRPVTARDLAAALDPDRPAGVRVLALSTAVVPRTAADVDALAGDRTSWPVRHLADAVARGADPEALLADVADPLDRLVRAGRLADSTPAWLALLAPAAAEDVPPIVVADIAATGTPVTCRPAERGWQVPEGAAGPPGAEPLRLASPATVVPDGPSVEDELLGLAAAEDVPALRLLAARLGAVVRDAAHDDADLLLWDVAVLDGERLVQPGERWQHRRVTGPEEALAAAWARFARRLLARPRRHPWPPWMQVPELVATFTAMSTGTEPGDAEVDAALEVDRALRAARGEEPPTGVALADALEAATAAEERVVELTGVVGGLERTLRSRDRSLRLRQARVEDLRDRLKAERTRREAAERSLAKRAVGRAVRGVRRRARRR